MNPADWNRRYLAYCRDNGHTPEEMARIDAERWPGGTATGYVLWNGKKCEEFRRVHRQKRPFSEKDFRDFDEFIGALRRKGAAR